MITRLESLDLRGRATFIRVDFDVPLTPDRVVKDDRRIKAALPTVQHAIDQGARVILASHLGRPRGRPDPELSLEPVAARVSSLLKKDVVLADDCVGDGVRKNIRDLREGDVLMLENLWFYPAEERNDEHLARALADGIDAYVDEAFSLAHLAHASTSAMVKLVRDKAAGLTFHREVERFRGLFDQPKRPFVVVAGGGSMSELAPALEGLLPHADTVLAANVPAYTMLASRGRPVGRSRVEGEAIAIAERVLKVAAARKVKLLLPDDFVAASEFDEASPTEVVTEIRDELLALDIGPKTRERWQKLIQDAGTVLWAGPAGLVEWKSFAEGTAAIAEAVAAAKATTIVTGDDTAEAVRASGLAHKITHVSGGREASLAMLAGRPMPGIKALDA